jgi:branched-chain amino acid transport system permease protein
MWFFLSLVVDGALAGTIYALIALAFVLVYKASHMINFALGEWVMFGALLSGMGTQLLGLGTAAGLVFAGTGMVALAAGFCRLVLRRLLARPVLSTIMVTLGLGMVMRGIAPLLFARVPGTIPLPIPGEPLEVAGLPVAPEKLVAACVATLCIAAITGFYRYSRTGVALRAMADDVQAAMSVGINVNHHLLIVWGLTGVVSVVAGVLWVLIAGGGFGVALVGLKVFPIIIVGGLDSIVGTIVGAIAIGVIESLGAGYLDQSLGGGFGNIASYLVLLAMIVVRPSGLFGQQRIERV